VVYLRRPTGDGAVPVHASVGVAGGPEAATERGNVDSAMEGSPDVGAAPLVRDRAGLGVQLGPIWRLGLSFILVVLLASPFRLSSFQTDGDVLDASWQWALSHAAVDHLAFGRRFLFTYGPLGFLDVRTFTSIRILVALSMVVALLGRTALVYAVLVRAMHLAKKGASVDGAGGALFALALVAAVTLEAIQMPTSFVLAALALLLLLDALQSAPRATGLRLAIGVGTSDGRRVRSASTGLTPLRLLLAGVLLAAAALIKSSLLLLGVVLVVIAGFALLASRARSAPARLTLALLPAAAWGTTLVALWVVSGQAIGELPHFLRGTEAIVAGYGDAMSLPGVPIRVEMVILLVALTCAVFLVVLFSDGGPIAARVSAGRAFGTRLGEVALVGAFGFLWWKEGVVRDDLVLVGGHLASTFVGIGFAVVALLVSLPAFAPHARRVVTVSSAAMLPLVLLGGFRGIAAGLSAGLAPSVRTIATLATAPRYEAARLRAYAQLRSELDIPASVVQEIGRGRVVILPWSILAGPAYGFREELLPVSQLYSAYTPYLDHLDTSALEHARPEFVLLQWAAIDAEFPQWQAPATVNDVLENYAEVRSGQGWVLMRYRPRGAQQRPLGSLTLEPGRWASVPACSGGLEELHASFHLSPFGEVRSFFFQLPAVYLTLREGSGTTVTYRLPWSDAPDGIDVGSVGPNGRLASLPGSLLGSPAAAATRVVAIRLQVPGWVFSGSSSGGTTGSLSCVQLSGA
jgi:hypothetical protein